MKQSFENFLLEKRSIINNVIWKYKNYSNSVNTIEDYKRICEYRMYEIWRDDLFIDKENRDAYINMALRNPVMTEHRREFGTGKGKINNNSMSLNFEYEKGVEFGNLIEDNNFNFNNIENYELFDIVRGILKKEKYVDLFINYYKLNYNTVKEYIDNIDTDLNAHNARRYFNKYLKILRNNVHLLKDFV